MIKARFAIELPADTWMAAVSQSFPAAKFRLLTGIAVDDGAIELGEVVSDDLAGVHAAIDGHADVVETERLHVGDERALTKYRTTEQSLYDFLRGSSLPPEFPVVVTNGWFEVEVTAAREQVRTVRSMLEASDWPHEVLAIVGSADPDSLLTARQRELLDVAVRMGYFEVPRECTLAELAAEADVDKSTASTILRRGEGSIVKWFLTGSGADTVDRPAGDDVGRT